MSRSGTDDRGRSRSMVAVGFGCALMALVPVVFWATADLEIPRWETIGPAFLPRILTVCLGLGGLYMVAEEYLRARGGPKTSFSTNDLRAAAVVILAFLAAFGMSTIGFIASATLFLVSSAALLSHGSVPKIPWLRIGLLAVILAFGIYFVFTRIFITNLS